MLFGIGAFVFFSNVYAQSATVALPKQQEDFQAIMNQMPTVPQELVGKRDGEPYLEKVDKFKDQWNYGSGKNKSKTPKLASISDWICSVNGAGDGKSKLTAINCYPLKMKRAHIFLRVKTPTVDKLFKGDIIKVSGRVSKIEVSNPVSDINYNLEIKDGTYELISKGQ
jgi:hypothetical protein